MPAIALVALGLLVALPMLSSMRLYAATTERYATVTVHSGDTLWSIASSHTGSGNDVQETVDRIAGANHLSAGTIQPGEHLRVPLPSTTLRALR